MYEEVKTKHIYITMLDACDGADFILITNGRRETKQWMCDTKQRKTLQREQKSRVNGEKKAVYAAAGAAAATGAAGVDVVSCVSCRWETMTMAAVNEYKRYGSMAMAIAGICARVGH